MYLKGVRERVPEIRERGGAPCTQRRGRFGGRLHQHEPRAGA